MIRRKFKSAVAVLAFALLLSAGYANITSPATAGPNDGKTQLRAAAIDEGGRVQRVVLLEQDAHTMPNTTPQAGNTVCIDGDPDAFAARLTLTGTLTGTNPVLTIVLQSSDDGGTTWMNVGSAFTAINATVTPAAGKERVTFADTEAGAVNTPVLWGSCFRTLTTWAGTGTVTANVGVSLYAE